MLTGDVTQDRRGLTQLDLAVDEVGQVGPVEPERGLDTLPLGAILEVTLFVVGASVRQQQADGLAQLTSQDEELEYLGCENFFHCCFLAMQVHF